MSAPLGVVIASRADRPEIDDRQSLEELIFGCTSRLLSEQGLSHSDVEGVVTGSSDLLDGRAISLMVTAGAVGAPGRDTVNVSSSGEHALVWALARAGAGDHQLQIVASWAHPSEAPMSEVERLSLEPFFTRPLGPTPEAFRALSASASVLRGEVVGFTPTARPPSVAPAAFESAIVTLLVATPQWCARRARTGVGVTGAGWISDTYFVGERLDRPMSSTVAAVRAALAQAGRSLEQCIPSLWDLRDAGEIAAVERAFAVDAAVTGAKAKWRSQAIWSRPRDTGFVNGLLNVVDAAAALEAGGIGLAHGQSGLAGQSASAFVLEGL